MQFECDRFSVYILHRYGPIAARWRGELVLLFASLLAVSFPRKSCLDAALFTWLEVVGVTLDFLDDVLLLYLPLETAQRIFQRLAFLYTHFCQKLPTSKPAGGHSLSYWKWFAYARARSALAYQKRVGFR